MFHELEIPAIADRDWSRSLWSTDALMACRHQSQIRLVPALSQHPVEHMKIMVFAYT